MLKFDFDLGTLTKEFDVLPDVTKKAVATTLNKVGRKANTEAKKWITQNYNIKSKSLKIGDLVILKKADARRDRGSFTIIIKKAGRGLMKYGAKQTKTGIDVMIKKSTKSIPRAFLAPWKKGQAGKFAFLRDRKLGAITRTTKTGKPYKAIKRRPLFGATIAQVYGSRKVRREIESTINKLFQETLDQEYGKQFEKRR